ncbi:MAG: acyl-CoA dehydrogenase family protein, partial [Ilumatobacteraceae bacterium]
MDFDIPADIQATLDGLDAFIEAEIVPLQHADDNMRFFDHRREWARTDFDNDGVPRAEWEALLAEMRRRADAAGHFRYALPEAFGGQNGTNLAMARIREYLAQKGLGLHNDLQNESSIVGNLMTPLMLRDFGTSAQQSQWMEPLLQGEMGWCFGLTEAAHGSDATWMETRAEKVTLEGVSGWRITGEKMWT